MSSTDASPSTNGRGSESWSWTHLSIDRPSPSSCPGDFRSPFDQHDHGDDGRGAR